MYQELENKNNILNACLVLFNITKMDIEIYTNFLYKK